MMTAASGGNRESLLGQWPARRKCFLSTKRMLGTATRTMAARSADGEVFQKNFLKKVDERMKMRYTVYC